MCISTSARGLVGGVSLLAPPPVAKAESGLNPYDELNQLIKSSPTKVLRFASRQAVCQRAYGRTATRLFAPDPWGGHRQSSYSSPSQAMAVVLFAPSALAGTSYAAIRLPAPSVGTNGP